LLAGHGGEDFVGEAGLLEGDEGVGSGVVLARLGCDGLQDEVVGEATLVHAEDGVVVHQGRFRGRWRRRGAGGLGAFDDGGGFSGVLGCRGSGLRGG